MESYQGMNQFQNQGLDPTQNQSVESYPGQKSVTYQTCTHATDSYHKNAAESFYLDEMKKLEMERALWKKDEQAQCKEISRLNDRIQMEVERRTDYEFDKAQLQEELEQARSDNQSLRHFLSHKSKEADKFRLQNADLQNKINNLGHHVGAASYTTRSLSSASSNDAGKTASCMADLLRRQRLTDRESDFAPSESSVISVLSLPVLSPSSSSQEDDDEVGKNWDSECKEEIKGRSRKKSSTLTRKEVSTGPNRGEKAPSPQVKIDEVLDDVSTLRQNIHTVNRKMDKNDLEIKKLETCVQSLTVNRDQDDRSDRTKSS